MPMPNWTRGVVLFSRRLKSHCTRRNSSANDLQWYFSTHNWGPQQKLAHIAPITCKHNIKNFPLFQDHSWTWRKVFKKFPAKILHVKLFPHDPLTHPWHSFLSLNTLFPLMAPANEGPQLWCTPKLRHNSTLPVCSFCLSIPCPPSNLNCHILFPLGTTFVDWSGWY